MKTLLLNNATVVLPDRELNSASVLIAGGGIAEIADNNSRLNADTTTDLSEATLYPGFIDLHIHGAVNVDIMDASAADLNVVSIFLASQGVTSWLPTLVPASDDTYRKTAAAVALALQESAPNGARVLGLHYEGPFVNSLQCGALHQEYFKTYSGSSDIECLALPSAAAVKVITLAPEIAGGVELVTELTRRGWVVSIGHTRADVTLLGQALDAGAKHMTHFMNAMSPLHHRNPGPIAWGLMQDEVSCDIIADGIHLDPYVLKFLLKTKGARGLSLISDAIAATGKGDGDYSIWGETISVRNGRTSNAAGSIAGSVISMLDAVRMMRSLGASNVEVAQMAATNPARLLHLDHELGSIEVGKRADLVALDKDGNVKLTVVGGQVVYER